MHIDVIMSLKDKMHPYSSCVILKGDFYPFFHSDSYKALAKHNKCFLKPFPNSCSWLEKKWLLWLAVSLPWKNS